MIKAKQVFFSTSNSNCHGFDCEKAAIFYLTSEYYSLSVLSTKLYFLEIGPVQQKLWLFRCIMLKTLNSNFLDREHTLYAGSCYTERFLGCSHWNNQIPSICTRSTLSQSYHWICETSLPNSAMMKRERFVKAFLLTR